jgi:hypothetical protein
MKSLSFLGLRLTVVFYTRMLVPVDFEMTLVEILDHHDVAFD